MKKMQYEKPTAEKVSFAVEDVLMDDGTLGPVTGSDNGSVTPPAGYSFDEGYQNP